MSDYYKTFKAKKNNKADDQLVEQLFKVPAKEKGVNMPHFQYPDKNVIHQADLLFLPDDHGFKYALVVIDVGTRFVETWPLESKQSADVLMAFRKIYARKHLSIPKELEVDDGSEFKGDVAKWFDKQGVRIRVAKPGRHRQQALVERANQWIGRAIFKRLVSEELHTGKYATGWVDYIDDIVDDHNKNIQPPKKYPNHPTCSGISCELLPIGTKVRVALDEPREHTNNAKLAGRFRAHDVRWTVQPRTIVSVQLNPGQPPWYLLDDPKSKSGVEMIGYTRQQLQPIGVDALPPKSIVQTSKPRLSKDVHVDTNKYQNKSKDLSASHSYGTRSKKK